MMRFTFLCMAFVCISSVSAAADSLDGDAAFARGDYTTAYRAWLRSAQAGDASAMSAVGMLYDIGHGVPQDYTKALSWYRRAANAGNVSAMFNVGAMFDNGRGTPVNRPEAIKWFSMAAERGHGRAAYDLGIIYRDGDGVPRGRSAAIDFFRLAAKDGVTAARTSLIALGASPPPEEAAVEEPAQPAVTPAPGAESGGVPRTAITLAPVVASASSASAPAGAVAAPDMTTEAMVQFQKTALARDTADAAASDAVATLLPTLSDRAGKGDYLAQYDVGYAYQFGVGVPSDPVRSYVYYLRALSSPDERLRQAAMTGATEVGGRLTDDQHASARDMLATGLP